MIFKYFLPFHGLSFHLVDAQKFLSLIKSNLSIFSFIAMLCCPISEISAKSNVMKLVPSQFVCGVRWRFKLNISEIQLLSFLTPTSLSSGIHCQYVRKQESPLSLSSPSSQSY